MDISAISGLSIPNGPGQLSAIGNEPAARVGEASSDGGDFFSSVENALQSVSDAHARVDELAVEAATGDLTAVHELTMATAEAQLLTQLTVEIRNRAVEAFNDIMRMQV